MPHQIKPEETLVENNHALTLWFTLDLVCKVAACVALLSRILSDFSVFARFLILPSRASFVLSFAVLTHTWGAAVQQLPMPMKLCCHCDSPVSQCEEAAHHVDAGKLTVLTGNL